MNTVYYKQSLLSMWSVMNWSVLKRLVQCHVVVICIWCALFVTSQFDIIFMFPNQRFGEVC